MPVLAQSNEFIALNPADYKKAQDVDVPDEVKSRRGRSAKHFTVDGKHNKAHIHTSPVHFKDNTGEWKQIDLRVRKIPKDYRSYVGREYEIHSGEWDAYFSKDFWNYIFEANGASVQFDAGAWQDHKKVDITVETTSSGLKETIELEDDTAPTKLSWTLKSSELLTLRDNYISVGDAFRISELTAIDAVHSQLPISVTLVADVLTVTVDTADAVFPVYVDPTTEIDAENMADVYGVNGVYATARTTATSTQPNLRVGQYYASYGVFRNFLGYDLTSLSGFTVTSCNQYVKWNDDRSTTDFDIYVVKGTQADTAPTTGTFTSFTGYNASGAHTPTYYSAALNSSGYSAAAWATLAFTATGITALNAAVGDSWLPTAMLSSRDISNTTPTGPEDVSFKYISTDKPYLDITYTDAVSVPLFDNTYRQMRS